MFALRMLDGVVLTRISFEIRAPTPAGLFDEMRATRLAAIEASAAGVAVGQHEELAWVR